VHKSAPHNSEETEPLRLLRSAIAGGDWELARASAGLLADERLPASAEGLKERVEALRELLNAARAGREHLAGSLARVSAAKRFQSGGDWFGTDERQNLVDSTDF